MPKKLPKWGPPKKKKREHDWDPPENALEPEPAFVVGAMLSSVNVDTRSHDDVEVVLGAAASEMLDQSGNIPVQWYRMVVPTDNRVVQMFFAEKPVNRTGEYRNPQFQVDLVIDGEIVGEDPNPDDVSRPVKFVEGRLLFLDQAMSETMEDGSGERARCVTKVELQSQLKENFVHPEGTEAVVLATTVDVDTFLIELQAEGFQECLEVPRASVDFDVDDEPAGEPN
jgi:hypothetical protein